VVIVLPPNIDADHKWKRMIMIGKTENGLVEFCRYPAPQAVLHGVVKGVLGG